MFDQSIPGFVPYRDNGDGTFTPRVAANPVAGTFVPFAANTPPGLSILATLTPGAGVWRIEFAFGSTDQTLSVASYMQLIIAGVSWIIIPTPCHFAATISALTLGVTDSIRVETGQPGAANSFYSGWIGAYPSG